MSDFDASQFNDALSRYMALTPRALEDVINKKTAMIIMDARAATPIADRSAVEAAFQVHTVERIGKSGKVRRKIVKNPTTAPLPVGLIVWRLRQLGKPIPSNAELQDLARKLPGARLRAIGSLRSGWKRSLGTMLRAAQLSGDTSGPRVGKPGKATPAEPGWDPVANWEFNLAANPPGQPPRPGTAGLQIDPRVEQALGDAFTRETASMEDYIRQKLQPAADAISTK
jgi:hypothetical protein